MQKKIDLRSDTVTQPTMRMRDAMYRAVVGDDVLGEDPTTKRLEELASGILGKESGLFLASGTMANQAAILTLTKSGDQIIVHEDSHIYNLEVGGLSATCGVQTRPIQAKNGFYSLEAIKHQVHYPSIQQARTSLLCLENTHDLNRGLVIPAAHINEVSEAVRKMGLSIYLDGARIFNAAAASGEAPADISRSADMVGFCLTKGLACPVGSLLVGPKDLINEARRMRQRLGGGWRQSGILAAAGIIALEEMTVRLEEDHQRASFLAKQLINLGVSIDIWSVQTNIIKVDLSPFNIDAYEFSSNLAQHSILVKPIQKNSFRMVTHLDIIDSDLPIVVDAVAAILDSYLSYNRITDWRK